MKTYKKVIAGLLTSASVLSLTVPTFAATTPAEKLEAASDAEAQLKIRLKDQAPGLYMANDDDWHQADPNQESGVWHRDPKWRFGQAVVVDQNLFGHYECIILEVNWDQCGWPIYQVQEITDFDHTFWVGEYMITGLVED